MADDISKNIIIQVTTETGKLEQSITNLNKIIDSLLDKQKELVDTGQQTSAAFQNNADKIDIFQKSLKDAITQLNSFKSALNEAAGSLQKNQSLITALTAAKDKYSKSAGGSSAKVKELNSAIKTLSASVQQQQGHIKQSQAAIDDNTKSASANAGQAKNMQAGIQGVNSSLQEQKRAVNDNKEAFNAHKEVMDHLKTSFDEIKGISGEFGPSLQDVATGFNAMKSGLDVMKGGIKGVGEALKADGFEFLLQVLQQIFNAFVNSSEGTKMLQGAISAIGVVVNKVEGFFNSFKDGIIDAITHPIDSIKALGKMIEQNIINRFTAFGTILDGIIHLDFKKITNGAIQAFTGVTNATDKIGAAFNTVKNGVVTTAGQMVTAYTNGYNTVGQIVDAHEKKVKKSFKRIGNYADNAAAKIKQLNDEKEKSNSSLNGQTSCSDTSSGNDVSYIDNTSVSTADDSATDAGTNTDNKTADSSATTPTTGMVTKAADKDAKQALNIYADAFKKIEDKAKASKEKIAAQAITILQNSIKKEADAKVASLEKQKNAELGNASLTASQRAAIQAKYKKQEDQVKAKAFKKEQEISIAQTLISAAMAEVKLWADPGFPEAIALSVVLAAETAAQIAKISSQKAPAYAMGGLHYTSDGKGGVLPGYSRADNTNAYLRSGEGIVVSEAMRDPWARNLVSAINVGFGGRDFSTSTTGRGFAVGGIFTDGGDANRYYNQPVNDNKNLANTIAYQMVNNFPPVYVDVKDINNQQNILAQTINRVNL